MSDEHLHPVGPDNPGYDPAEPNSTSLLVFILLSVLVLVGVFVGVTAYWDFMHDRQEEEVVLGKPSEELATLHAREDMQLKTYGYIDKGKGVVQIPLDRAMELVVKESAEGKPKYSTAPTAVKKEEPAAVATAAMPAPAEKK